MRTESEYMRAVRFLESRQCHLCDGWGYVYPMKDDKVIPRPEKCVHCNGSGFENNEEQQNENS